MLDLQRATLLMPFQPYIEQALGDGRAVINVHVPARRWKLKQTATGSVDELSILNDVFLHIWDTYIEPCGAKDVFFVSSGLASYSICHLVDKRDVAGAVRGVVVISPTLFLPISSAERADWYRDNSLVIVPTRRTEGAPIATNSSFGSCISSGTDDPNEIASVVSRHASRVLAFIKKRSK